MRPVQFTVAPLNSGIVASTASHIIGVVVVVVISVVVVLVIMVVLVLAMVVLVLAMVVLVLAMVVLVLAMVVLVLAMVVLVLAIVVVVLAIVVVVLAMVVVVVGPLGQNWCPNRRSRSHTNGIFWLQRKSFHAAGIVASPWPMEMQYSRPRQLLGSSVPLALLPVHKQSTSCVQHPFIPELCAQPLYPPALAG
jgi:hypothetical protein